MGCQRSAADRSARQELLSAGAERLGITLNAAVLDAFALYEELLLDRGSRFNLTAVRDSAGIQRRHFLESLAVGAALAREGFMNGTESLLDVGSGAGFPGLPVRLVWPRLRLSLVEATRKKAGFLRLVAVELGLRGVQVINARAEDAAHAPELRERFDLVLARAVAPLPTLAELTLPFVRRDGVAALVKGSRLEEELRRAGVAIRACGGGRPQSVDLGLVGSRDLRLLVIPKRSPTPTELPRKPGIPAKFPLH